MIKLIVAVDADFGLAKNGQIPWSCPEDMKRFKRLTIGDGRNAVIMGRKTWQSLPEKNMPLPQRLNVVLTTDRCRWWKYENVAMGAETERGSRDFRVTHSFDDAVMTARSLASGDVWIIGGAQVYSEALASGKVSTVEVTRIDGCHYCDLFVEDFKPDELRSLGFHQVAGEAHAGFSFETWGRA